MKKYGQVKKELHSEDRPLTEQEKERARKFWQSIKRVKTDTHKKKTEINKLPDVTWREDCRECGTSLNTKGNRGRFEICKCCQAIEDGEPLPEECKKDGHDT